MHGSSNPATSARGIKCYRGNVWLYFAKVIPVSLAFIALFQIVWPFRDSGDFICICLFCGVPAAIWGLKAPEKYKLTINAAWIMARVRGGPYPFEKTETLPLGHLQFEQSKPGSCWRDGYIGLKDGRRIILSADVFSRQQRLKILDEIGEALKTDGGMKSSNVTGT